MMKDKETRGAPRCLCALLCLALLLGALSVLTSCANGGGEVGTGGADTAPGSTDAEGEAPEDALDLPSLSFGGFEFRVLDAKDTQFYGPLDVAEGNTGEAVNDAIYERNRIIEDLLDIRFNVEIVDFLTIPGTLERQVKSGYSEGTSYELVQLCQRDAYSSTIAGYSTCLNDLEYMDTNKSYFFRTINEQCSIGGYPFFAYGADAINLLAWACCMVYNKKLAADLNVEDLYAAVRSGEWTHEKLFALSENAAADLDGDGKIKSGVDRLGLVGILNRTVSTLWESSGEKLVIKDENGMPAYNATGNERLITIMTNALAHLDGDAYDVFDPHEKMPIFMDGKSLFFAPLIGQLNTIRTMDEDYGVLPFPKYDKNQKEYISRSAEGFVHLVPATCRNGARTGAVLQALAYYSQKTVYDAYYEQALTTRFLRDADSVEMLKLILSTLTVDIGDSIWFNTISTPILTSISTEKSKTGLASLFKRYEKQAQNEVRKVTKFLEKVGS